MRPATIRQHRAEAISPGMGRVFSALISGLILEGLHRLKVWKINLKNNNVLSFATFTGFFFLLAARISAKMCSCSWSPSGPADTLPSINRSLVFSWVISALAFIFYFGVGKDNRGGKGSSVVRFID